MTRFSRDFRSIQRINQLRSCPTQHFQMKRLGLVALEAVMVAAVMVPLSIAFYFLAIKVASLVHNLMFTCVSWPYP